MKGETSGHRQWVREVRLDCDGDTLLVKVDQEGAACHTGDRTCFDARVLLGPSGTSEVPAAMSAIGDIVPSSRTSAAGRRAPGDPGLPPAAGRRRDRHRPLPQAGRRTGPAATCWSRPSRASGRATPSSAYARPPTLTERDGQAVVDRAAPAGLPSGGRSAATPCGRPCGCCTPRAPTVCRRSPPGWWATWATTRYVGSSGCRTASRRPRHPGAGLPAGLRSRRARPLRPRGLAGRQRDQLRRHRRAGRRGVRRRRRPGGGDDRRAGRPDPVGGGRRALRRRPCRSAASAHRSSSRRPSRRRSRRSRRARRSRSWSASGSRSTPPPTRSTSTGCCGCINPSPYMYLLRLTDAAGGPFDIVGSSPGGAGHGQGRDSGHPPDRRLQAAGRDARGGRRAGGRAARRPQGAGRARDARRPRPQRPRPGLPAGHGRGGRVHGGPPLQPHHAPGVDRHRPARRRPHRARRVLAAFPAGTLSGAPKVRAMEIIDGLEVSRRGAVRRGRRLLRFRAATPTPPSPSGPRC